MNYRERQREKAIKMRDEIFRDPGSGVFFKKEREFVLSEPSLNLWEGIRADAISYFKRNRIDWWHGGDEEPTGHLLSSQVACINHLYFVRQRKDIATAILQEIDTSISEALIVDDGYVEFEFIGERQYLQEKSFTRGANCTSIDAVMIGKSKNGEKNLFLIEWKYTENYNKENKYITERANVYDKLIQDNNSPFQSTVKVEAFYFEPFYQLMRQTLLGKLCVENNDHGVSSYCHLHIIPDENKELKESITSPYLNGKSIEVAWKNTLKDPSKYLSISPQVLLRPCLDIIDTNSILDYLENRYW